MESQPITIERVPFASLGDEWHDLARAGFHADYAGVSEMYGGGAATANDKIALMRRWGGGILAWTARDDGRLVGLLTGDVDGEELTIYDFFVDAAYRRRGEYGRCRGPRLAGSHWDGSDGGVWVEVSGLGQTVAL